jgi:hypothetical protein
MYINIRQVDVKIAFSVIFLCKLLNFFGLKI